MTRRWMVMLSLLGISGWLAVFGDKTPSPIFSPSDPVAGQQSEPTPLAVATPAPIRRLAPTTSIKVLPLLPRQMLMAGSRQKRNLFTRTSWAPPVPPPLPSPPVIPTAPPLPFTYLGKKYEAGQWEAYLGYGDQTFIVREGSTMNGQYHVDTISPPTLTLTYLPLSQAQTLPIGGVD